MLLIAFGVAVCALGELNLVLKGFVLQLSALGFEVLTSITALLLLLPQAHLIFESQYGFMQLNRMCYRSFRPPEVETEVSESPTSCFIFCVKTSHYSLCDRFVLHPGLFLHGMLPVLSWRIVSEDPGACMNCACTNSSFTCSVRPCTLSSHRLHIGQLIAEHLVMTAAVAFTSHPLDQPVDESTCVLPDIAEISHAT
jgi:hypothetical protein